VTLGGLAAICDCFASPGFAAVAYGGCAYSQALDSAPTEAQSNSERFPGLKRGTMDQAEIALGPIIVEMFQLFELTPAVGLYDDSNTCNGNAGADPKPLFPAIPNLPFKVDGTIVLGTKLLNILSMYEHQTAAVAAVCAHEFGHILQFKYLERELAEIRKADKSVVRIELFADFICGYHAGIRKLRQEEYPAVIQALNQFKAGDHIFGPSHHGTPEERARSVREGFQVGIGGRVLPEMIAKLGLQYVKGLTLEAVHAELGCEKVDDHTKP
jgi:hypothetical protein